MIVNVCLKFILSKDYVKTSDSGQDGVASFHPGIPSDN